MGNCRIEEKFRSCHRNFEWAPVRMPRVYSLYPSSTWTLISPDSSPGVLMANPLESGNSFVSPGVEAIALASRTYGLDGALTEDMSLESSEGSRSSMCCTHQPKIHCSLLRCLVSLFGRSLHYDDKERSSGLWVFIDWCSGVWVAVDEEPASEVFRAWWSSSYRRRELTRSISGESRNF